MAQHNLNENIHSLSQDTKAEISAVVPLNTCRKGAVCVQVNYLCAPISCLEDHTDTDINRSLPVLLTEGAESMRTVNHLT
ncbi:hypothetical protein J4Q44_G00149300 [Coregonus suidteri]|uniref:Uncharacterized protein n=1 Tax=Coregonus suidteri TaxID=861788 RepID=A0AAN8M227_9TELE